MTPVLIPCSRSAHDQNVFARRPQWDQHGCHSKREKQASLEGSFISLDARSEGQSGCSLVEKTSASKPRKSCIVPFRELTPTASES